MFLGQNERCNVPWRSPLLEGLVRRRAIAQTKHSSTRYGRWYRVGDFFDFRKFSLFGDFIFCTVETPQLANNTPSKGDIAFRSLLKADQTYG